MIAKDYIDSKTFATEKFKQHVVSVSDAYKAIDMAKNEFAESINNYQEQKVKGNIADYVKSYCEGYCEGIISFIQ